MFSEIRNRRSTLFCIESKVTDTEMVYGGTHAESLGTQFKNIAFCDND
ncbi:hypothetical protein [Metasolibacillus sp. FSL K6-0083]